MYLSSFCVAGIVLWFFSLRTAGGFTFGQDAVTKIGFTISPKNKQNVGKINETMTYRTLDIR
jgi:hypothetical protein